MNKKLKVAVYCRVSTDKDDQANSFKTQIEYFTKYIQSKNDWELYNVYSDEGISGTCLKKRDGFNTMIRDAQNGKIQLIITKEISRFARNTVDCLGTVRKLKKCDVGVLFINDNINTLDGNDEFKLTLMASLAQEESRKTSERVKWGQKRQMEKGVVFGRDLLGYRVKNGKLELVPDEAEIIKEIFSMYLYNGMGLRAIALALNNRHIPSKSGKLWSATVISKIINNEKYVGDLKQQKTFTPDYLSHKKKYNKNEREYVYIKNHHSDIAIIDRKMWDLVQEERKRRFPNKPIISKFSNRYWCSNKVICGCCDSSMNISVKHLKNDKEYRKLICYRYKIYGKTLGCIGNSLNFKSLGSIIYYLFGMVFQDNDKVINNIADEISRLSEVTYNNNTELYKQKSKNLYEKRHKLLDYFMEGFISKDEYLISKKKYNDEINVINEKINTFTKHKEIIDSQKVRLNKYKKIIINMFSEENIGEIFFDDIVKKVVVFPDKILQIFFNCLPFGFLVKYETKGKMESFETTVISCEIINE